MENSPPGAEATGIFPLGKNRSANPADFTPKFENSPLYKLEKRL